MTLTELATAVATLLGVTSDDGLLPAATIKVFVQEALHAVEVEQDWDWLRAVNTFSTVAGTDAYDPPGDWAKSRTVRLTDDDGVDLNGVGISEANEWRGSPDATGRPQVWTIDAGKLILRPVPDAAYVVEHRYLKTEPTLAAGDSPLLPLRFQAAVVHYACDLAWQEIRDDARAATARARYEGWLQRMKDDRRRSTGPSRIRVR